MGVALVLARYGARRRMAALLAIAVVVALGLGTGLASLEIADRTEGTYAEYRQDAEVAELVVNPSMTTDQTAALLREIDGVESVTSDALLTALPDVRAIDRPLDDVSNFLQVRVSTDGRYTIQDRPVVHEGRMIRDGPEAFISADTARSLGLSVGDRVPLLFFSSDAQYTPDIEALADLALASVEVTVVGVGAFSDEVLPDDLLPRQKILVTPDVGADFDCIAPHPDPDDPRPMKAIEADFFPPECSTTYHYFSMRIAGGDAGAKAVGERIAAAFEQENADLPAAMQEVGVGYFFIPSFAADDAERLEESLSPIVLSLRAFALVAIVVTIALAGILSVRHVRQRVPEADAWRDLGAAGTTRTLALVGPVVAAAVAGCALAAILAWVASGVGAIGSAGALDGDSVRSLGSQASVAGGVALLISAATVALVATPPTAQRRATPGLRPGRARSSNPPLTLGLRAARRGGGAFAVLAGTCLAVVTVTAMLVFTASLLRFTDEPERYGWPYDVAALVNAGYDNPRPEAIAAIEATLDDPGAGVARWGRAALSLGTQVNGTAVPVVGMRPGFDDMLGAAIAQGRMPQTDDEVALGQLTADALDVGIGEQVEVSSQWGERTATVTGFVVLPAVGALESDRASLGTGLLLPAPFLDALATSAAEGSGTSAPELADASASFVAVDLEAGVDAEAWLRDHEDDMLEWDPYGVAPLTFTEPVRPPVVVDVEAMQRVPALLAGVLALAMVVAVVAGVAAGTRARRRELAVLRALGGSARQVRASVRWHALAVVGTGLVVGIPLGIALGRTGYHAFARTLGATPEASVPLLWLGVQAVVVLTLAPAAAAVPGRRSARRGTIVEALRPRSAHRIS
jgi:ABC-type lipoprotein release transport system permease subunit